MTSSAGCSGLIALRIAAQRCIGVAHRREIDDAGHAGEVLQQHARRHERDLAASGSAFGSQLASASMSACLDDCAVLVAQQVLEQDLQRERQPPRREAGLLQRRELWISNLRFPTSRVDRLPKLFAMDAFLASGGGDVERGCRASTNGQIG